MGHSESPPRMPPARNRLEALYSDVMQQLEQLQFSNIRNAAKQYFHSPEVKGWIRYNSKKSTGSKHSTPRADAKVQERLKQPNMPPDLPKHSRPCLPHDSVNSECRAFSKHWTGSRCHTSLIDRSQKHETASEVAVKPSRTSSAKSPTLSNRKVLKHQGNESGNSSARASQSSSEIGRFRKSIESKNPKRSSSEVSTTAGCETLAITRRSSKGKSLSMVLPLTPIETECSSTFTHTHYLQYIFEGASPLPNNKIETRPASLSLRRQFNCNRLMEGVKNQRALDAKHGYRKRECRNPQDGYTPEAIVILRSDNNQASACSRITNESTAATPRNGNTIQKSRNVITCAEVPSSYNFPGNRGVIQEAVDCNGSTREHGQIGGERPRSEVTLDLPLAQQYRSLATASRTTAILQEALEALECAHRWNEWGARTLHELARASKAAAERNRLSPGLCCKHELQDSIPEPDASLLLPHDNDVMVPTRRGRVLDDRDEERAFIRDLLVASGVTSGDWVHKSRLLHARPHLVRPMKRTGATRRGTAKVGSHAFERKVAAAERENKKKLTEKRILYDFVQELMRQEFEFRNCAQMGMNLLAPSMPEQEIERKEPQALVQKVWNHLQICPPAAEDICTAVQHILQRDLQALSISWVEMAEVLSEIDKMIYQDLMEELLKELQI